MYICLSRTPDKYILEIESPVICRILDTADENGLFFSSQIKGNKVGQEKRSLKVMVISIFCYHIPHYRVFSHWTSSKKILSTPLEIYMYIYKNYWQTSKADICLTFFHFCCVLWNNSVCVFLAWIMWFQTNLIQNKQTKKRHFLPFRYSNKI